MSKAYEQVYDDPSRPWRGRYVERPTETPVAVLDAREPAPAAPGAGDVDRYSCYTDTSCSPSPEAPKDIREVLITCHTFPDGSSAGVATYVRGVRGVDSPVADSWWRDLTPAERHADNDRRANGRAQKKVIQLCRYADLTRLLTFTNGAQGDGWEDPAQALDDVSEWLRWEYEGKTGAALLGDTPELHVPERGERNYRLHVHMAIRGGYRLEYSAIIRHWSAFMESKGFHSLTGTHRWHAGDDAGKHAGGFKSARQCARYMAKYLSKGFTSVDRDKYRHRYRHSALSVPEPERAFVHGLQNAAQAVMVAGGGWAEMVGFKDPDGHAVGFWFELGPPGPAPASAATA